MNKRCLLPRVILSMGLLVLAALACNFDTAPDSRVPGVPAGPLVLLIAPVNGSAYAEGVAVQFYAIAQDSSAGVARLEFRLDSFPVGDVKANTPGGQPSLEAQMTWTAVDKRGHILTAEAFRADGSSLGSADVTLKVVDNPAGPLSGGGTNNSLPTFTPSGEQSTAIPTPTGQPVLSSNSTPQDQVVLTGAVALVNTTSLNIRQGPGTNYPAVGSLVQGERVQIVGRSGDSQWWAVTYRGGTAWVLAQLTQVEGDISQIPLVAAPQN
ncbi:MAG: SH3 domain-containing protein [Chloroflexi bacterium]|nr:SH3 domain-containing protein [Chloroflexota bacterium]